MLAGAPTFAVCAGLQLLARSFLDADGRSTPGLGVLDVDCDRLNRRAVGQVVDGIRWAPGCADADRLREPLATPGWGCGSPLRTRCQWGGNGDGRTEGAQQEPSATYLHGPALFGTRGWPTSC